MSGIEESRSILFEIVEGQTPKSSMGFKLCGYQIYPDWVAQQPIIETTEDFVFP